MFDELTKGVGVFDFEELANHLLEQGSEVSPARVHGCLSGVLAAGAQPLAEVGLDAVTQALNVTPHGDLAEQVMQLYTVSAAALADEEFAFHPLLPDDEEELDVRTEAMADWCAGFLLGFAHEGARESASQQALSPDSTEILSDMAAMAEATLDAEAEEDEESKDDAENNYFELVEYLRFAVLNVFMDTRIAERDNDSFDDDGDHETNLH